MDFVKLPLQNNAFLKRLGALCRKGLELPIVKNSFPFLAYAQPLFLAVLTYVIASKFAAIGVDAHHDGIMFKPALDVAEGKMLFRDTFTHCGALTTLLHALALKIFGHYLLVIRLETAFFYALTVYFLWLIWKRLIPQWLATLCGFIYIFTAPYFRDYWLVRDIKYFSWFLPWSSVYALFFQVFSFYLLILFIEKRSRSCIAATGASVALTMWARQPVGALLFCAMSFFLICLPLVTKSTLKKSVGDLTSFVAGFFTVNVFFVIWLALNHAFKAMWQQSVISPLSWVGPSFPVILSHLFPGPYASNSIPSHMWVTLPVVCLILFFRTFVDYLWGKTFDTKQLIVFASVMVCLASWGQYYPVPCERHTYWAFAPMIGVFVFFVWGLARNGIYLYRVAITLFAMVLTFQSDITHRIKKGAEKLYQDYVTLDYPKILQGMRVPSHDALFFQGIASDIDDYFKRHPAGGFINYGRDALYTAFGENLTNFHPSHVYWQSAAYENNYADYRAKFEKYTAERKPIIVSYLEPVIYAGYTIKSVGGDLYVTVPGDPESVWYITAFRIGRSESLEPHDSVRNYSLELQYAGKKAAAVRSIVVVTSDLNGTIKGGWLPAAQSAGLITFRYVKSSSVDTNKSLPNNFIIPENRKIKLSLTGHEFLNYSTALKIKVLVTTDDGVRFQQVVSFLPLYGQTPKKLVFRGFRHTFRLLHWN